MDFVALQRRVEDRGAGGTVADRLFRLHDRLDIQQAKAFRLAYVALDAVRIAHHAAQHLVAAANANDMPTASNMPLEVAVPPLLPQEQQVAYGGLGARQDHKARILRQWMAGRHEHDLDRRLGPERIEVIEIGDARQHRHGDLERAALAGCQSLQHDRILGRQPAGRR